MGMHVWYRLTLGEEATFAEAIEKIAELHRYATTIGFRGAAGVPPVGKIEMGNGAERWRPTFSVTRELGSRREQALSVPAIEWVGFSTMPGKGTETAHFGLARYPETFRPSPEQRPGDEISVGAKGWSSWSGWCKTQYAHRYGLDHFMHCHLTLIKLLDRAKDLGILDYVNDAGGYWETRSADVLVANLREHDRIVAAFVGGLKDQIGGALEDRGYISMAPIQAAPDFEHLEAEGRETLGEG